MKLVLGITGASGSLYAKRAFAMFAELRRTQPNLEVHWIASRNAPQVWQHELGEAMPAQFEGCRAWDRGDFFAPFASGSNPADAVLLMPCSMSNLARAANGGGDDLLARTVEVALKERKRVVLVVRETPLSLVHLRNMTAVTEAGAIVLPAVPHFYGHVKNLDDAVDTVVQRALDRCGVALPASTPRWGNEA